MTGPTSRYPGALAAMQQDDGENARMVRDWLRDLRRRNLRPRTVEGYGERVAMLVRCAGERSLLTLTADDLEAFLDGRGRTASTRHAYIAALESFFRWAVLRDLTEVDPMVKVVRPIVRPGRPKPLGDAQLGAMLDDPETTPEQRALLLLGALAGLRAGEMSGLDVDDVDFVQGVLLVRDAKGGRDRQVPIHPVLADALRAVMPARGPVFRMAYQTERRADRHRIGYELRRVMERHGGGHAHRLRHSFASRAYQSSRDILAVADLLGHASVQTTQVYAKLDQERGAAIVAGLGVPGAARGDARGSAA